jgi:hypothetical protein
MANHSRWCKENPKRKDYVFQLKSARDSLNLNDSLLKKRNEKIKIAWKSGKYKDSNFGKAFTGKNHTEESKKKMKEKALLSNHRRLKKRTIEYKGILLDSSWEYELAKRLDSINIKWDRPKPLKWKDEEGFIHNYFPDFYLLDYNLYLDPKNPEAIALYLFSYIPFISNPTLALKIKILYKNLSGKYN